MPIATRRRKLVSYIKDALIAPISFVLVAVIHGWWLFVVMAVCFAICLALGGAGCCSGLGLSRNTDHLLVCFSSFSLLHCCCLWANLFTDRLEQVWIPDERCLDISQASPSD